MELQIKIVGENVAKVDFGTRSCILLGIQKGEEIIDTVEVVAGKSPDRATFTAVFAVSPLPDGGTNFLGPYAHGSRAARFCYLCWLEEDKNGTTSRFGRVKLPLSSLRWERVEAAARAETPLVMRFSLAGKNGGPVFASLPVEAIQWEG